MSLKSIYFGDPKIFNKGDAKPTVILLLGALVPTLHRYFGMEEMFSSGIYSKIPLFYSMDWSAVLFFFVSAFILMGVFPYLLMKYYLKGTASEYGLQVGDWQLGLKTFFVLFPPIAIALLLPAAFQIDFVGFYPTYKYAEGDLFLFIGYEFTRGVFYYLAWEFFFRGFMLFGLRRYVGDWNAILIQTIASCLWHIGYPPGEILMAIPGGIMFGMIALKTRSIIWPLLLHWFIGIGMDAFIVLLNK